MHHSLLIYLLKDILRASNSWHTQKIEIYLFRMVRFHLWILLHSEHHQMLPMTWGPNGLGSIALTSRPGFLSCLCPFPPKCSRSSLLPVLPHALLDPASAPSCLLSPLCRKLLPQVFALSRSQLKWHLLWEALPHWKKSILPSNPPSQTPVLISFSAFFAPWNGPSCLLVCYLSPHRQRAGPHLAHPWLYPPALEQCLGHSEEARRTFVGWTNDSLIGMTALMSSSW